MSETFEAAVGLLRNDPSRATASAKCEKFGEARLLFRAPGYAFVITLSVITPSKRRIKCEVFREI